MSRTRVAFSLLVAAALVLPAAAAPAGSVLTDFGRFKVGAAAVSIAPTQHHLDEGLYLGGYGLGNGKLGLGAATVPYDDGRAAAGVMADPLGGPYVRAIAISDGTRTIVLADLANQGMFAAYKPNPATGGLRPWGIDDIRAKVAADTGIPAGHMVISSNHSHGGQDLTGVWGFVPDDYMAFVYSQAVKALEAAVASLRPARIVEGAAITPGPCDPTRILNNQFDCADPSQGRVDQELRVLQARDAKTGKTIATVVNFAAHATVMGSSNRLVSPDWPGVVAKYLEQTYGGVGITLVADVGRSQPARSDCTDEELDAARNHAPGAYDVDQLGSTESCKLSKYSRGVMPYVAQALASATRLQGVGVNSHTMFIHEPATNLILFAGDYAGDVAGAPIARSYLPPYLAGTVLGTWVSVFRVGSILITTAPGEAYPNIREQLMAQVSGPRRFWTIGLANDQLGYLIAPTPEGYPTAIQEGAGGNDNYLFNVSHTIGDHVMCAQVRGVLRLGVWPVHDTPAKCLPFLYEPNTAGLAFPPPA